MRLIVEKEMKVTNNKCEFDIPKIRPKNRNVVEIHLVHWKLIFGSKNKIFNVEAVHGNGF